MLTESLFLSHRQNDAGLSPVGEESYVFMFTDEENVLLKKLKEAYEVFDVRLEV